MNRTGKTVSWSVWIGVVLMALTLTLAMVMVKLKSELATQPPQLPFIGLIPDFTLTNQLAEPVTRDSLKGHVWVADIIFTRCAGPCPVMTRQLREVQDALPANSTARLVTLTTDADYDTAPVLKEYANKHGARAERWSFLTGDKRAVAYLAIDGLKLTAIAKPAEERTDPADLFVHSTIFVIVDKQGQLRGVFETQGPDIRWPEAKAKILAAIKTLESAP